jgi:hypothetical protein
MAWDLWRKEKFSPSSPISLVNFRSTNFPIFIGHPNMTSCSVCWLSRCYPSTCWRFWRKSRTTNCSKAWPMPPSRFEHSMFKQRGYIICSIPTRSIGKNKSRPIRLAGCGGPYGFESSRLSQFLRVYQWVVFNLFIREPPDEISLQLCTPRVVGIQFKSYTVCNL